jgi:hypothetical protein
MTYIVPIIESKNGLYKKISDEEFEDAIYWPAGGLWVSSYQKNFHINCVNYSFEKIEEFHRLLQVLNECDTRAIMRAIAAKDYMEQVTRRALGDDAPFSDGAINWVCLDIDDCPLPDDILEDEIAEFVMFSKFPVEFHNVDYVAQFSNRAGLEGWKTAKLHFWILLEEGVTNDELKLWQTHNLQFDPSVFKTVQPIYTSKPKQIGLLADLEVVKERVRLYKKEFRTIKINVPAISAINPITKNYNINGNESHKDEPFMKFVDGITAAGAHENVKSAVASYYSKFGINCDWVYFKRIILEKYISVAHPRAQFTVVNEEIDSLIGWAQRINHSPNNHLPYNEWIAQLNALPALEKLKNKKEYLQKQLVKAIKDLHDQD